MADPATYRPKPGEIPTDPGVYRFLDQYGRVIYVGKAKNLRARLSNYFQDLSALHPRTQQMVTTASSVVWTVVGTEVEALSLEYSWIKEFEPRFNIKYRDDKSYPYLAVTLSEEFPRAQVMRGAKKAGNRYFGPFSHAWAIRETVDLLLRVFPIRTCSKGVFVRANQTGRPCLLGYIDKCSAPCVGRISQVDHRQLAEDFCAFMAGDTGKFVRRLEQEMKQAAQNMEYERAAGLRDDLAALQKVVEKNAVVLSEATDADVFGLAQDELEAAVQVFHVRGGRIRGQRGWVVEKVEDVGTPELVEHLLQQVYGEGGVPRQVLVPELPPDPDRMVDYLRTVRAGAVELRVPQRGEKRELAATVTRNAEQALALHKTRRSSDLTTRSAALQEIQDALGLPEAPLRIECYDISTTQGTHQVGSMVVFEDGLPRKSEYRHFTIRGENGDGAADDTAAMYEVISRRFRNYATERQPLPSGDAALTGQIEATEDGVITPERKRFAYPPNLVVVDGAAPQVNAAARAMADLGVHDVALCGLAKRLEEVWLPEDDFPVVMPRTSEGLYLLQRVRDEAHRFAITHHRKRRSAAMISTELDGIAGLGPVRQRALLKHFGSVKKLRAASVAQIAEVSGIGQATAETVHRRLNPTSDAAPPTPAA